jgi:unsaturated rhamnogalacturonyl hydrolase
VQQLVKGLAKYQDPKTGLWYQVVDKGNVPENWLETSSSSMYTYVISKAVRRGYVTKSYNKVAEKGYKGVLSKISTGSDGLTNITDICEGTNVADLNYYLARKRNTNDFHGLGAFLIMNEQMMIATSPQRATGTASKSVRR